MDSLNLDTVKQLLHRIRQIMEERRDELIEVDAAMGDGDLGLTMVRAFKAADEEARASDEADPGKLLSTVGMTIARAAPSTMGTLMATGLMRGGKAISGNAEIGVAELAEFFAAFTQGVMQRGKCEPGDKTIVDVLQPVSDALNESRSGSASLAESMERAYEAARQGHENTKQMKAQHGRPAYYQDQSIGKVDPGATAGLYFVQGFKDVVAASS